MSDPTLKKTSVSIRYTASDGYRSEVTYSNRGRMGVQPPPNGPFLEAIDELGRLAELFGFGDEAADALAAARGRVITWRADSANSGALRNSGGAK